MSRLFTQSEKTPLPPAVPLAARGGLAAAAVNDQANPPAENPTPSGASVYLELLVKMIPTEVVSFYTFAIGLVPTLQSQTLQYDVGWSLTALATLMTPFFLSIQESKPSGPALMRALIWRLGLATVAFPLWAIATSGDKLFAHFSNDLRIILFIGVAAFTAIAGLIAKATAPPK